METKPLLGGRFENTEDSLKPVEDTYPSGCLWQGRADTYPFPLDPVIVVESSSRRDTYVYLSNRLLV